MIRIENLTRRFGAFTAVDNLSFQVAPGEVLGFLGPNGAGKSTTMKMITGFLQPTSGRVDVFGYDMWRNPLPAKKLIGYLPEGAPSYGEMAVRDFLAFIADVRGLRGAEKQRAIAVAAEKSALTEVMLQTVDTLSKGYRRRVGIAQAILHDPQVLILDEPTDGLDPNQKHHVRELIRSLS
ncbi:MAG TPA: ABC transporter ATP-binding protein, partial [Pseudomonadales bacterium]|nr:ABC transporter ATP-binding protein [Pseudomonadales bacterium]